MSWDYFIVCAHLLGAILLVGYCLFWAVMTVATRREFAGADASGLLQAARDAAWPLPGMKLTLPLIGWLLLVLVSLAGVLCLPEGFSIDRLLGGETYAKLLLGKLFLSALLLLSFPRLGVGGSRLALLCLGLALAIVVVSAQLAR